MTSPGCERIALADLTDYAAGDLPAVEAAAIEEHLFSVLIAVRAPRNSTRSCARSLRRSDLRRSVGS